MPKNTVKIRVTRVDLRAPYENAFNCPIALAARRFFGTDVSVGRGYCVCADKITTRTRITHVNITYWRMIYKLKKRADRKAFYRSQTWWGQLIGGFDVVLTEIEQ